MAEQKPTIGRIVTYRTRAQSFDIPAIITAVIHDHDGQPTDAVHLEQFAPPIAAKDTLSFQWGAPYSREPKNGHWRWPERV